MSGLGRVRVEGPRFQHVTLNGELMRYPLRVLPPGTQLAEHLSIEINRPFDDAAEPPFRPFMLEAADGTTTLGLTYQHWVADSAAVRLLLREWFVRLFDPARARPSRFRQPSEGYWRLFGPAAKGAGAWRRPVPSSAAISAIGTSARSRRLANGITRCGCSSPKRNPG